MKWQELQESLIYLTKRNILNVDFARALGINKAGITVKFKEQKEVKQHELIKVADYFNLSIDEIINNTSVNNGGIVFDAENLTTKEKTVSILYYPDIYASCGNGVLAQSENCKKINVPLSVFFTKVYDNKTYFVINAYGNSMCPFIEDNDKLIVEKYENEQIKDNRVYLFSFDNEIFIKRLVKNVNQLVIMSDNKEFDVIKLSGEDINKVNVLGQVVGIMRDAR